MRNCLQSRRRLLGRRKNGADFYAERHAAARTPDEEDGSEADTASFGLERVRLIAEGSLMTQNLSTAKGGGHTEA